MKFWHVISIFRSEKSILNEIFAEDIWLEYKNHMLNLEEICLNQKREILDKIIPNKLAHDLLSKSSIQFFIQYQENSINIISYETTLTEGIISILDLYLIIGADLIEEILDKTYITITDSETCNKLIKYKKKKRH